jgi:hypothetical protein
VIRVKQVRQDEEHWTVQLQVEDGVYRLPAYPVRVENVPRPPENLSVDEVADLVGRYVLERVTTHMREGSLPPRGTRLDGRGLRWER